MTAPRSFLMALAQALSYRRLYGSGHPLSREAVATAVDRADFLLSEAQRPVFQLHGPEVTCDDLSVRDPGPVGWANRLWRAGVHRIEVHEVPDAAQMNRFLQELERILESAVQSSGDQAAEEEGGAVLILPPGEPIGAAPVGTPAETPAGTPTETPADPPAETPAETPAGTPAQLPADPPVQLPAELPAELPDRLPDPLPVEVPEAASSAAPASFKAGVLAETGVVGGDGPALPELGAELASVSWIWTEVEAGRPLPVAEAEAVVRSLGVLLRELPPRTAPRIRDVEGWEYGPLHALHTAILAMAWARDSGATPRELVDFGLAGLFHDVGLVVSAPGGRLDHAGSLDEDERALVEAHPVEGARLLLASDARLSLAAVVAFEHHLLPGGGGYPAASLVGDPHTAARVIQVLSSYDALRSTRPHRLARSPEATREVVRSGGGRIFDAAFVQAFERFDPEWPAVAPRASSSPRRGEVRDTP